MNFVNIGQFFEINSVNIPRFQFNSLLGLMPFLRLETNIANMWCQECAFVAAFQVRYVQQVPEGDEE